MVVNTMVATMAKHGKSSDSGLFVYHATSSTVNPCTMYDLFRSFYLHFAAAPMTDTKGSDIRVDEVKFFDSLDEYQTHVEKDVLQKGMIESGLSDPNAKLVNGLARKYKRVVDNITHLGKIYEPYFFNRVRYNYDTKYNFQSYKIKLRMLTNEGLSDFAGLIIAILIS